MLANLSFRTKLMTLLGAAVIGFVVVTAVALQGLKAQNTASERFEKITKVQNDLSTLVITMMEHYEHLGSLSDETYQTYLEEFSASTGEYSALLDNDIAMLESASAIESLGSLKTSLTGYSESISDLVTKTQYIGFNGTSGLKGDIWTLGEEVIEKVSFLSLVKQEFLPVREAEKNFIFEPNESNKEAFMQRYDKFYKRIVNFGLEERFGDIVNGYFSKVQEYDAVVGELMASQETFKLIREEFKSNATVAEDILAQAVQSARKSAADSSAQASISVIMVSIVVALVAAFLMMTIGKSVSSTLGQIIRDLGKVKDGDLTARLAVNKKRNDEFDSLCSSVNEMTTGLGGVIGDVVHTTRDVTSMVAELNTAVGNIASSNRSVNERTNNLATATEEISTTISSISHTTDELSQQSQNTYESAIVGAETIKGALSNLGQTIAVVNQTSNQLNDLGQLSKDIDNVIGMINDLANQTNLLALNAAIEAARAGEAGRGFSVVADEVRSLAEKTVDATAKITDIVGTIQSSTQTAIDTMHNGQENLRSIEEFSEKAELAIREIERNAKTSSASSVEMARSIQEVAKTAVHMSEEMDRIAQQLQRDNGDINRIEDNTRHIHEQVASLDAKTGVFTTSH